jgi:hypothetical protein
MTDNNTPRRRVGQVRPSPKPANYPPWEDMTAFCADRTDCLTERERDFIRDLPNWTSGGPTWNQYKWLVKIFERLTDPDENVYSRRLRQAIGGK